MRLSDALPVGRNGDIVARQLIRSESSVGANYRAACRAKSVADFAAKMAIVEEEADETAYWLELIVDSGMLKPALVQPLLREANELVSIAVASIRTSRGPRVVRRRSRTSLMSEGT
jgi:four helix bundle protein